jgi:hypothetical protein
MLMVLSKIKTIKMGYLGDKKAVFQAIAIM